MEFDEYQPVCERNRNKPRDNSPGITNTELAEILGDSVRGGKYKVALWRAKLTVGEMPDDLPSGFLDEWEIIGKKWQRRPKA
jgi:hypothetical protein